ncbi:MAG: archease [Thermoplasmata archaeon]|nr:MAG: archease [Thermoplasmata archaeon]
MKYEIIEHTADVGVKAYGDSIEECFENVAKAMFDIIVDDGVVDCVVEKDVVIEGHDYEDLLFSWLSELVYIHHAELMLFTRFDVKIEENNEIKLRAKICGEKIDFKKHKIGLDIKAVTYHMLEVNAEEGYVQVIFDI